MVDRDTAYAEHRKRQLLRALELSYVERLKWLEGAKKFGEIALGAARLDRELPERRPDGVAGGDETGG